MPEPEYRTPEEWQDQNAERARIRAVIDQAAQDATSLKVAMRLHEPPEVVEAWVNRVWDGLRAGLDDDERLAAIVDLLESRVDSQRDAILRELREAGR